MPNVLHEAGELAENGRGDLADPPPTRRSFELIDPARVQANGGGPLEYRFHEGARSSLTIAAVLCFVLVVAAPVGIWALIRMANGKVRISKSGLVARGLGSTTSFEFDDVARLGLLEVPIVARGLGGALVRRRVGGDKAIHLVVKTRSGRPRQFIVSSYENYHEILSLVSARTRKPYEAIRADLFGIEWT